VVGFVILTPWKRVAKWRERERGGERYIFDDYERKKLYEGYS
jgi:hypothetical protein